MGTGRGGSVVLRGVLGEESVPPGDQHRHLCDDALMQLLFQGIIWNVEVLIDGLVNGRRRTAMNSMRTPRIKTLRNETLRNETLKDETLRNE